MKTCEYEIIINNKPSKEAIKNLAKYILKLYYQKNNIEEIG